MYRSGFVGIFGFPNSGKSTLTNVLIGEKVSIVSSKPQTTRRRVNGILSQSDMQLVFVDSPGFVHGYNSDLNEYLAEEIENAMEDVDVGIFLLALDEVQTSREPVLVEMFNNFSKPKVLVITKGDLMIEGKTLDHLPTPRIVISAKSTPSEAIREIILSVKELVPQTGAPLYDPDMYTTQSSKELAAEVVREKCFTNLGQEIPYNLAVSVRSFKEEKKMSRIECDILVAREGQKGIVIGEGAAKLKKIGTEARKELEEILGTKVYLGLHVAYKSNWMKSRAIMKDLGYVSE